MPLLDKIGKIASTATLTPAPEAQAATESKASSYTERLAQSKGEVQERINRLLLELGRAYYKHHADDCPIPATGRRDRGTAALPVLRHKAAGRFYVLQHLRDKARKGPRELCGTESTAVSQMRGCAQPG